MSFYRCWETFPLFPSTKQRAARSTWVRTPSTVTSSVPRALRWTSWYQRKMANMWVSEIRDSPGLFHVFNSCLTVFVLGCSAEGVSGTGAVQDCLGRLQTGDRTHRDRRLIDASSSSPPAHQTSSSAFILKTTYLISPSPWFHWVLET